MIEITNASRELNKVEQYLMTISPEIISMKDVPDGEKIIVSAVCYFNDIDEKTGTASEICSILTPDKKVYCCQSGTFKRSLNDIMGIMGDGEFTIKKISGKTKAGRDFINCVLDVDSLA